MLHLQHQSTAIVCTTISQIVLDNFFVNPFSWNSFCSFSLLFEPHFSASVLIFFHLWKSSLDLVLFVDLLPSFFFSQHRLDYLKNNLWVLLYKVCMLENLHHNQLDHSCIENMYLYEQEILFQYIFDLYPVCCDSWQ